MWRWCSGTVLELPKASVKNISNQHGHRIIDIDLQSAQSQRDDGVLIRQGLFVGKTRFVVVSAIFVCRNHPHAEEMLTT